MSELTDEDKILMRNCIKERMRLIKIAEELQYELDRILRDIEELSNKSLAKKFEVSRGCSQYQESLVKRGEIENPDIKLC